MEADLQTDICMNDHGDQQTRTVCSSSEFQNFVFLQPLSTCLSKKTSFKKIHTTLTPISTDKHLAS